MWTKEGDEALLATRLWDLFIALHPFQAAGGRMRVHRAAASTSPARHAHLGLPAAAAAPARRLPAQSLRPALTIRSRAS